MHMLDIVCSHAARKAWQKQIIKYGSLKQISNYVHQENDLGFHSILGVRWLALIWIHSRHPYFDRLGCCNVRRYSSVRKFRRVSPPLSFKHDILLFLLIIFPAFVHSKKSPNKNMNAADHSPEYSHIPMSVPSR